MKKQKPGKGLFMFRVIKEKFSLVGLIWGMTFRTLRHHPVIIVPFLLVAFLEAIALTVSYLAPRPPLSAVLAPPIRALFEFGNTGSGEAFLHYPFNFLLLPRLLRIGQVVIGATVGVVMTAVATRMIAQASEGAAPSGRIKINLRDSIFRYFTLLVIWGVVFSLGMAVSRGLPRLIPGQATIIFYFSLGVAILVETFFVYGVAAIMLENQRAWRAIGRTFSLVKSLFLPTLILVLTPLIFPTLFIFIRGRIPLLMEQFFPGITLYVLGLSILVSFLATCILRTSTVILFLVKRDTEKAA